MHKPPALITYLQSGKFSYSVSQKDWEFVILFVILRGQQFLDSARVTNPTYFQYSGVIQLTIPQMSDDHSTSPSFKFLSIKNTLETISWDAIWAEIQEEQWDLCPSASLYL